MLIQGKNVNSSCFSYYDMNVCQSSSNLNTICGDVGSLQKQMSNSMHFARKPQEKGAV